MDSPGMTYYTYYNKFFGLCRFVRGKFVINLFTVAY